MSEQTTLKELKLQCYKKPLKYARYASIFELTRRCVQRGLKATFFRLNMKPSSVTFSRKLLYFFLLRLSSRVQTVEISLEEGVYDEQLTQQDQSYHFALSGRAFAVITEYFPQLVQKVRR